MKNREHRKRWGILGGTFDPIHNGHLTLARDCLDLAPLDRILFVPSFDPPHKPAGCKASFEDRTCMLELAVGDNAEFAISTIERDIDGPGYTLNLVRALKKRYPEVAFSFIIGADNITQMLDWHQPERIFEEVRVIAGTRPGFDLHTRDYPEGFAFTTVPTSAVNLSATEIRSMLAREISLEALAQSVPQAVAEYIFNRKLYRP